MSEAAQTPPAVAVADSMQQAAAITGLSIAAIRLAKKGGCPAFRGSRVVISELKEWLDAKGQQFETGGPGGGPSKEQVEIWLKLERLEGEKLANAETRKELQSITVICDRLRAISEEIKGTLRAILLDQLPAQNAGLDAPKQRENNRAAFEQICRRFQSWAAEYNEALEQQQQRQNEKQINRCAPGAVPELDPETGRKA